MLRRVFRRLYRQTDTAVSFIDLDHARRYVLADLEHVLDLVHAIFADLRNMHQAVDVVLKANERAETGELRDLAADEIADFVILVDVRPRIFGELFDAERNALVVLVDFQHHGFDFLALLEHLGRMIDLARPGNIRDVDHAIEALFQFDEGAIAGKIANLAFDLCARRIILKSFVPWIGFELANA